MSQSSTATVLGARAGERKEGAEESRKAPRKELSFAESCRMSRSLSHGQPAQAKEQDVHKHGGGRKPGVFRDFKYLSVAANRGWWRGASEGLAILFAWVGSA